MGFLPKFYFYNNLHIFIFFNYEKILTESIFKITKNNEMYNNYKFSYYHFYTSFFI